MSPDEIMTSGEHDNREQARAASVVRPPTPAVRQRLQVIFQRSQQCMEKGDHDYAHDLLVQCLVDDPGNLIFLQHLLSNLANKYSNNKKGARFAGLKVKGSRAAMAKAAGKGQWREAFQSACDGLKVNPWDTGILLQLAEAEQELDHSECQLYLLRWALDADPKDVNVNRRAGVALSELGHFDQAIACWRRVEQAKPGDEEAAKAISQLGVEKTIQQGGYDTELLGSGHADLSGLETSLRSGASRSAGEPESAAVSDQAREKELLDAVDQAPTETAPYLQLAEWYRSGGRLADAERVLHKALAVSGGGDLAVREQFEDAQIQRAQEQVTIAQRRADKEGTKVAVQLAKKMAAQANQVQLEVFAARAERDPGNTLVQYELGLRLKKAGKFKEAIRAFQAARDDSKRKAMLQLHLGECFQHIRQFPLAMTSYAAAVEATDEMDVDTRKLALYRAGVLAMELRDHDRAEKFLTDLAGIDFGYRDVADRLDKLASIRDDS